ncbi:hypothetical protein ACLOJK_014870, partial [Asimina triloba]
MASRSNVESPRAEPIRSHAVHQPAIRRKPDPFCKSRTAAYRTPKTRIDGPPEVDRPSIFNRNLNPEPSRSRPPDASRHLSGNSKRASCCQQMHCHRSAALYCHYQAPIAPWQIFLQSSATFIEQGNPIGTIAPNSTIRSKIRTEFPLAQRAGNISAIHKK